MKILKFGGSSVGDSSRIKSVLKIIEGSYKANDKIAVVVSAFFGVTNSLIEMGSLAASGNAEALKIYREIEQKHISFVDELISEKNRANVLANVKVKLGELRDVINGTILVKELTPRTLDFIMSFGERLSAYIISECVKEVGIKAEFLDTRNVIKTDENFGSARVNFDASYRNIRNYFDSHTALQIATGFIGSTEKDETTTIGRGGSDYTASILGAALSVQEIEIWTDVDGAMTADPKKVPSAFPIEKMTYLEAIEISHFGARVIYPPTIEPASRSKIPLRIKNTFNPDFPGTLIDSNLSENKFPLKGITSITGITLLKLKGSGLIGVANVSERLFGVLARNNIRVMLITQASSEHSISFAVDPKLAMKAKEVIELEFYKEIDWRQIGEVVVEENLSVIAAVGEDVRKNPKISGKLFQTLGEENVNVVAIAQGSSELNISVVVSSNDEIRALNAIHNTFFSSKKSLRVKHLFLVGAGLIGGTLFNQIKENNHSINVVAIADVEKMLINPAGIKLDNWKESLKNSDDQSNFGEFIKKMNELNLPGSVFVDCTASDEVASRYLEILEFGISIVTPSKRANSSSLDYYQRIRDAKEKSGAKFLYETNVGAGLPVIRTLNSLVEAGDKILKIEAILSGSLSYIFNNFAADKKFSQVVLQAKEKGYTEPNPKDDLVGTDVQRKILILARELGVKLEMKDVEVESVDKNDEEMETRVKAAAQNGCVLRYIATLENGKAKVALKEVNSAHPFYSMQGSDNIISFTTKYYCETPLVIKGPGAGANVTASGVLSDILSV